MKTIDYTLSSAALRELISGCARPIEAATVATGRFDERLLRTEPDVANGVRARGHVFEAQALIHLAGRFAGLEDMVLHGAGMDRTPATLDVLRGVSLVADRKALSRLQPDGVLSLPALRRLLALPPPEASAASAAGMEQGGGMVKPRNTFKSRDTMKPWDMPKPYEDTLLDDLDFDDSGYGTDEPLTDDDGTDVADGGVTPARSRRRLDSWNDLSTQSGRQSLTLNDPDYDSEGRFVRWHAVVEDVAAVVPAVLTAAVALDAWLMLEPAEHRGEVGYALAASLLQPQSAVYGLATAHLPTLGLGLHRGRFRWSPALPLAARISGLLAAISEAAGRGTADLQRLSLAREVMLRACKGRSKNSRLPALVDLFVSSPLVTVQLAAKRLGVSAQAVEVMLKELGSSLPRELTGRKRYRAWGVL
jgi:hypothetical protein